MPVAIFVLLAVELWTINNYHWYMKQSLEYNETNGGLINAIVWDPVDAYQLHIILNTGYYVNYRWVWTTDHSLGYNLNDQCTVAVVDAGMFNAVVNYAPAFH
jgi:elongator complex protein 1